MSTEAYSRPSSPAHEQQNQWSTLRGRSLYLTCSHISVCVLLLLAACFMVQASMEALVGVCLQEASKLLIDGQPHLAVSHPTHGLAALPMSHSPIPYPCAARLL